MWCRRTKVRLLPVFIPPNWNFSILSGVKSPAPTLKGAMERMATVKTMGKAMIKSNFDESFTYFGMSKQCEVMYGDYMKWCDQNKAPKAIQAERDKYPDKTIHEIFVLFIDAMTPEEFESATGKSIATNRKPTTSAPTTPTHASKTPAVTNLVPKAVESTAQKIERLNALLVEVIEELKSSPDIADYKMICSAMMDKIYNLGELDINTEPISEQNMQIRREYQEGTPRDDLMDIYGLSAKELEQILM